LVVASPNDPARSFKVLAYNYKHNIFWHTEMIDNMEACSIRRHVADGASGAAPTIFEKDHSRLDGLQPLGFAVF